MNGADRPGIPLPGNRWDLLDGVLPEHPPLVSVIVAHYEQQRQLDRTCAALARQDHPADRLEVIVVDDGSATAPIVPPGVRLLRQEDRGFRLSAARNLGARAATGQVLCFLDADTVPEPGYVSALTRLPALSPDCVVVGRRRHADLAGVAPDVPIEEAGPAHELPEPAWLIDAYRASRNLLDADDRSYRFLIGAVIACSRSLFDEVGGFDETFSRYGGEDWEWAYRMWLAGAVFAHEPTAVAWHDGPEWAERDGSPGADGNAEGDSAERDSAERDSADGNNASRVADKNAETIRLSELIPVPGSGPIGSRPVHPDIVVRIEDAAWSSAQRFVCADALQAALPRAERDGDPARARIIVAVHAPVRPAAGVLRAAVDEVVSAGLGSLVLTTIEGAPVVTIVQRRAETRMRRWGDRSLFPAVTRVEPGLRPVPADTRVAAYLGGWD